ncbi:tRNA dimethylallyltransferase isoform X2 [Vespula squamosa]|uniref:tRNA dimethylallyltransferase isoform X2 n=1 Tax=Vespula squamosa TaxID=30214 RepID=A0ABD2ADE1_VESSQ
MAVHHMLDIVDPLTYFSVTDFRDMALPIVDDLILNKKMPIVVGGTNYYIESILWKILVSEPKKNCQDKEDQTRMVLSDNDNKDRDGDTEETLERRETEDESSPSKKMKIDGWTREETNEVLHRRLAEIDPEMAQRLHPNNRRKILKRIIKFNFNMILT